MRLFTVLALLVVCAAASADLVTGFEAPGYATGLLTGQNGWYLPAGTDWNVAEGGFGGQPGARLQDGVLDLATRAPHGDPPQWRACALNFIAPADGMYTVRGEAACRIWDGKNKTVLHILRRTAGAVSEAGKVTIEHEKSAALDGIAVRLSTGDALTLLPQIDGMYAVGDCRLKNLEISSGPSRTSGRP